jgi:hypothetical protein
VRIEPVGITGGTPVLRESPAGNQKVKYDRDVKQWQEYSSGLKATADRLSKYEVIVDAEAKAAELEQAGQANLENANREAAEITTEARETAKKAKSESRELLDTATIQAGRIIADAKTQAEKIAGDAYEAMKNADLYEQTAKAMKNVIKGYGDEYIIPSHSLLDDLAEEFGYTQAGRDLQEARERSRAMIRNGTAATCDYVEASRRDTAINFVMDAFNGKVDSILSRVKHDNAGKLKQEILDAFTLVNFNGKAFRFARITEEYRNARLEELKWAAVAQQLRLEEREEQRRYKQQMREEAKARKEYERAMREAEKEEEMLRKAMEKAQQQAAQATAEQRAEFERQLEELGQKLKEAEERNQRAISMAQQTKRGHVYVISNIGSFGDNVYKIGLTRRLEPLDRVRELGDSSVPFEFDVHALIPSEDAPALETALHKQFALMQVNKINYRKEFFRADLKDIREQVDSLGLDAKWTMAAEAREYRESLAVEKALADNPAMQEAWINRQLEMDAVSQYMEDDEGSDAA